MFPEAVIFTCVIAALTYRLLLLKFPYAKDYARKRIQNLRTKNCHLASRLQVVEYMLNGRVTEEYEEVKEMLLAYDDVPWNDNDDQNENLDKVHREINHLDFIFKNFSSKFEKIKRDILKLTRLLDHNFRETRNHIFRIDEATTYRQLFNYSFPSLNNIDDSQIPKVETLAQEWEELKLEQRLHCLLTKVAPNSSQISVTSGNTR